MKAKESYFKFLVLFFIFVFVGCSKKNQPVEGSSQLGQSGAVGNSGSNGADLSPKKVDGSKLIVTRVAVADFQNKNSLEHSLSYEVIGRPQYVEYWIIPCSDKVDCFVATPPANCVAPACYSQRTSLLRARVPTLWPGRVRLMIHACVDASFSSSAQNCGPMNSTYYEQKHYNIAAEQALFDKVRLVENMGKQMGEIHRIMKKFNDDVQACEQQVGEAKEMLDAKTALVRVALGVPYDWFTQMGEAAANAILAPVGSDYDQLASGMKDLKEQVGDAAHEAMKNVCISIDRLNGIDYETQKGMSAGNITCKIAEVIPHMLVEFLVMPLNFSKPFGVLSDIFTNISAAINGNAGAIVPKNCTAEQDFNLTLSATKTQMDETASQLKEVRKKLVSFGLLAE